MDLAAGLVERDGVDGVTMAALAEAADYAPASLYTYFPSRSALLSSLQRRALAELGAVARANVEQWNSTIDRIDSPPRVAALARLWAFSDLFLTAPQRHPREFKLQQQLLVNSGAEETADAATVVPAAMMVLEVPRQLLADAGALGAIDPLRERLDPVGHPLDGALMRTFAWVVALNGALMVDGLSTGLPSTGAHLGGEITDALLRGWGADHLELADARTLADDLARLTTEHT